MKLHHFFKTDSNSHSPMTVDFNKINSFLTWVSVIARI